MFGEYLDAFPGRWLVWNGGGPLGPRRYACREHRGDLVAYLRYHYATVAAQVWKMPPYTQRWPDEKRPNMGGSMGIIKFGLRGGLLQERPVAGRGPEAERPPTEPPVEGGGAQAPAPPGGEPTAGGERSPADAPPAPAPDPIADGVAPVGGSDPPGEVGAPGDGPAADEPPRTGETPSDEDLFPPGELLAPADWYPTDDPLPSGELFPPGELFLPTDGLFAPEGETPSGPGSSGSPGHGEGAWPPDDEDPPEDDGAWPDPPPKPPPAPA
jgi:hypothetical protein